MDLKLDGKKCFIMSSSRGIGKGIAIALAMEGAKVILSSSNADNLNSAIIEVEKAASVKPLKLLADVKNLDQYLKKVEDLFNDIGGVDILVTNGPGPKPISCDDISSELLQDSININIKSQILMSQIAIPYMQKNGWGRVIHLTSTTGKEPEEGMVLSNLTRAAVGAYSKTVAREYGKFGITSNTVLTGGVLTERTMEFVKKDALVQNKPVEEVLEQSNKLFPTGYFPEPLEFGTLLTFLCSPRSNFLNGVSLPIDGGISRSI